MKPLLQHFEELGSSTLGGAVLQVEDWRGSQLAESSGNEQGWMERAALRTLFNTVLLVSLELLRVFVLVRYACGAFFEVVFVAGALR